MNDSLKESGPLHTLGGRIEFSAASRSAELAAGQMRTLEHGTPHDAEVL